MKSEQGHSHRSVVFFEVVLINPCEGGAIYFDPGDYIFLHDG